MKAFPTNVTKSSGGDGWKTDYGMDLRDYFAAKAFQSLIAYALPDSIYYTLNNMQAIDIDIELLSRDAYLYADAMMEARNDNK
jgi:hypothetical protein